MRNRTTLTKSLHTVTVVSRVAADMAKRAGKGTAERHVYAALQLIGQGADWAATDPTVEACVKATDKLLAKGG